MVLETGILESSAAFQRLGGGKVIVAYRFRIDKSSIPFTLAPVYGTLDY
jgi:hypothetical protein